MVPQQKSSRSVNSISVQLIVVLSFVFALPQFAEAWQSNDSSDSHFEGGYVEGFESPETCFLPHQPDCPTHKLVTHTRTSSGPRSGKACEMVRYAVSHGTHYYFRYPIKHAHLIAEFSPSIWIKSTRPGIQLSARVVLPDTVDPTTGGPMTLKIDGPLYTDTGRWQQLSFANLKFDARDLLNQQTVLLGRKYEVPVSTKGAYADAILLNMYTTAGETIAWIDDLKIEGAIPMDALPQKGDVEAEGEHGIAQVSAAQDIVSKVQVSGRKLLVDGQPFHVRMVRSREESFARLSQLGFNTVLLNATANSSQLRQAEEAGIWIVCPPPPAFDVANEPDKYRQVLCWSLGSGLATRDVEIARRKAATLRQTDPLDRPVLCSADSSLSSFARFCDLLILELQPLGTSFDMNRLDEWLARKRRLAGANRPLLLTVQSEYPRTLQHQIAAFDGSTVFLPVEHIALQKMAWSASSVADGIFFTSRRSLDADDPQSRFRAKSLKWVNDQLQQLQPWLAAGRVTGNIPTGDANVTATLFETNKSRLLLLMRKYGSDRVTLKSGAANGANIGARNSAALSRAIHISDATIGLSDRTFRVDDSGFTPVVTERIRSGATIRVENFSQTAAFVVTGDTDTISYLKDSKPLASNSTLFYQHRDLTAAYMALVNRTLAELSQLGQRSTTAHRDIENVLANLAQSDRYFKSNNRAAAIAGLERADRFLRSAWQGQLYELQSKFDSPVASPLIQHFATLPAHFRFVQEMQSWSLGGNMLPAGDFENFRQLTESGWKQNSIRQAKIESSVLLSNESPVAGESAMHIRAWRTSDRPMPSDVTSLADHQKTIDRSEAVEESPVWVTTAPVRVKAGQIIRVHGSVKINREILGSPDGMMVIDSIGGPELANRFSQEAGWQPFSIYRVAETNEPLTLTFAMTGLGEAILDEVTIRVFEKLAAGESNAQSDVRPNESDSAVSPKQTVR